LLHRRLLLVSKASHNQASSRTCLLGKKERAIHVLGPGNCLGTRLLAINRASRPLLRPAFTTFSPSFRVVPHALLVGKWNSRFDKVIRAQLERVGEGWYQMVNRDNLVVVQWLVLYDYVAIGVSEERDWFTTQAPLEDAQVEGENVSSRIRLEDIGVLGLGSHRQVSDCLSDGRIGLGSSGIGKVKTGGRISVGPRSEIVYWDCPGCGHQGKPEDAGEREGTDNLHDGYSG
jgi:hypothetical protein